MAISETNQNRLSCGGVEICPSPLTWPLAYTTACTTIQAVINGSHTSQLMPVNGETDSMLAICTEICRN